ncbi:hypothetical protein HPB49_025860 [Dermacentor silvarum]|nr:hypothetical protein HPB49_025860 [Dermacentor silvarum]
MPDDVMYKIPEVKLYLLKQNIGEPSVEPPAKKIKMEKSEGEKQPDEKEYWRVNIDRFHQHLRDQLVVQAVSKRMGAKAGEVVRTMLRLSETRSHPKDAFSAPVSRSEIYQSLQQQIKISQKDRFGAKSCRIFRLLLEKKYLEQKQIEELAMITARDAKEMTYKMFQEKFVLAQELPRTPDYAPSRMIYLFHVDIPQCAVIIENK